MPPTAEFTQGRIRVNEDGAEEVWEALRKHVDDLLDGRDTVLGVAAEATNRFNRRIAATRRVIEELDRVYEERGWDRGANVSGSTG